jgi:hypothetical protein
MHGIRTVRGYHCYTIRAWWSSYTHASAVSLHQPNRLRHSLQMRPDITEIQAGRLDALMQQMQWVLLAVADSTQNLVPFTCHSQTGITHVRFGHRHVGRTLEPGVHAPGCLVEDVARPFHMP